MSLERRAKGEQGHEPTLVPRAAVGWRYAGNTEECGRLSSTGICRRRTCLKTQHRPSKTAILDSVGWANLEDVLGNTFEGRKNRHMKRNERLKYLRSQGYDLFLDRPQPLILQPLIGHSRLGAQGLGQPVWPLATQADGNGQPQVGAKPGQFADFGPARTKW